MMLSRRWTLRSRRGKSRSNSVSPSADLVLEPRTMAGEAAEEDRSEAAEEEEAGARAVAVDRWSRMLPELMGEILGRVEASEDRWPARGSVVSCACVCRRWRRITTGIVRSPAETGMITFPASLKQPGPKDSSIQCFIKRNKKTSTFYLYLGLTQSLAENGKFLMAARRFRHGTHTEYIISLDADNLSQGSNAYLGKLRSDFLGTKFLIYDSLPLYDGAKATSTQGIQCFASKRISPQVAASNFEIGQVSYKSNILRSRGPRRILCKIQCPSAEPTDGQPQGKSVKQDNIVGMRTIALKNKSPRWHQHLQCWCLNFHGRVTVASVKNFQLVETVDIDQPGGSREQETVLLQFGRVGDDLFTMDYRHPLSAFQAFAISLSSYGSKFACE